MEQKHMPVSALHAFILFKRSKRIGLLLMAERRSLKMMYNAHAELEIESRNLGDSCENERKYYAEEVLRSSKRVSRLSLLLKQTETELQLFHS